MPLSQAWQNMTMLCATLYIKTQKIVSIRIVVAIFPSFSFFSCLMCVRLSVEFKLIYLPGEIHAYVFSVIKSVTENK